MEKPSKQAELAHLSYLQPLGETAIFYVPSHKLELEEYGREGKPPRIVIEEFFLRRFGGLTHEQSNIQGKWKSDETVRTLVDRHDRYEVSFSGTTATAEFLEFMSALCKMLDEESIYLTLGNTAWLVKPND